MHKTKLQKQVKPRIAPQVLPQFQLKGTFFSVNVNIKLIEFWNSYKYDNFTVKCLEEEVNFLKR